jgi:hypothetical protein
MAVALQMQAIQRRRWRDTLLMGMQNKNDEWRTQTSRILIVDVDLEPSH